MRKTKSKAIIALTIIAAIILSLAVSRVSAEGETYTIRITATGNYTVAGNWDDGAQKYRDGEFIVGTNNYSGVKSGENFVGTVSWDEDSGDILISIPVGTKVKPNYNGGAFSLYNGDAYVGNEDEISGTSGQTITLTIRDANQNDDNNDNNNPPQFDGNAYFAWVNSDGSLSYHKFVGLAAGSEINYVSVAELTDDSGNGHNYSWGTEPANWVLAADMEDDNGNVKPEVNSEYVFGDGEHDMGIQLDPCGADNGANSICTNADRQFRATVYNEYYQAVSFGNSEEDYTYFPSFWDPTFFTSTIDISSTSKSNPAVYTAFLMEPEITFRTGLHSKSPITSVKALDVNSDAVEIRSIDGVYKIKFNSKYYDHVIFEITTEEDTFYLMLARATMMARDNFGPGCTNPEVRAQLFYPSTTSYEDYEVVATKVYRDGSTKTLKPGVTGASQEEDPSMREEDESTVNFNAGKGLKSTVYTVPADDDAIGVYFTVVNNGALDGDIYGGTYSGSGIGVYYDLDEDSPTYRDCIFGK